MELTQEQRDRIAANRAAALKIRAARLEAATAAASLGSGKQTNLLDHSFSRAKGTGPGGWVHDNSAGTAMGTKPESLHDTSHRQVHRQFSHQQLQQQPYAHTQQPKPADRAATSPPHRTTWTHKPAGTLLDQQRAPKMGSSTAAESSCAHPLAKRQRIVADPQEQQAPELSAQSLRCAAHSATGFRVPAPTAATLLRCPATAAVPQASSASPDDLKLPRSSAPAFASLPTPFQLSDKRAASSPTASLTASQPLPGSKPRQPSPACSRLISSASAPAAAASSAAAYAAQRVQRTSDKSVVAITSGHPAAAVSVSLHAARPGSNLQELHGGPVDTECADPDQDIRGVQDLHSMSDAIAGAAAPHTWLSRAPKQRPQLFDYFVVYDFEATCDRGPRLSPQEIIEFSCVVLNARTLELGGRFQQYVKPTEHPLLTRFCMELTHITQDRVDKGLPLAATLEKHDAWLRQEGLVGAGKRWVPVTWSDWDFKVQMEMECKWRGIPKPAYFQRWIDLRQTFSATLSRSAMGLKKSVQAVGLAWEGRQHSGLDDALNTARLAAHLIEKGAVLAITGSFTNVDASGRFRQATLFPNMPQKKHRIVDANGSWTGKCECGVKAQQRRVNRPGVHHGRMFYGCGTWTITKGGGCNLLKWFSDVTDQERKAYAQC